MAIFCPTLKTVKFKLFELVKNFELAKSESSRRIVAINMHILRPFLVILLSSTFISFTKPRFILKCLTCLNPNCIKSYYDITHNFVSFSIFYSFVKNIFENLRLINGHFKTICIKGPMIQNSYYSFR